MNLQALLRLSDAIDTFLRVVAHFFGWAFFALVTVICFDVITRKIGYQLDLFGIDLGSTRLQELEWHLHGILFLTWLGYAYVRNAHVRIDVFTATMSDRKQAWLELMGCVVFALPYVLTALPYAHDFFLTSFRQWEGSPAPNGLGMRWIIKLFLYFGFWSVLLAVISVAARRIVFLMGPPDLARRAMPSAAPAAH
jgi:TRAP-type mannitol/chloroaromatic compound transport system permease small subunit